MNHLAFPPHTSRRAPRIRPVLFVLAGLVAVVMLVVTVMIAVPSVFARAVPLEGSTGPAFAPTVAGPFEPSSEDGLIRGDETVTLADDHLPAIGRLDPALREAMSDAADDAAAEGLTFRVTSGWRSDQYQRWLFTDAVGFYGSEEVARQYVATPEKSSHVTGRAVDIVPMDAQFWLIENGWRYGICQTYANERWHFERATTPGGVCPDMKADAAA